MKRPADPLLLAEQMRAGSAGVQELLVVRVVARVVALLALVMLVSGVPLSLITVPDLQLRIQR